MTVRSPVIAAFQNRALTFADECMKRLQFLVGQGAHVDSAAVEAAKSVSRSTAIVRLLQDYCTTASEVR